ncbi:MAG: DUF6587 family protein [Caldimonas sp.]
MMQNLAQDVVVAVVVLACFAYATWSLLPAGARRGIALRALKLPLNGACARFFGKHAAASSGCGCDGCDRAAPKTPPAAAGQPITFHRRPRRS